MPVQSCFQNGKPGFKYGESGKCYTYFPNNELSKNKAKQKAYLQGAAITKGVFKECNKLLELEVEEFIINCKF